MHVFDIHREVVQDFDFQLVTPSLLLLRRDLLDDFCCDFVDLGLHVLRRKYVLKLPIFLLFRGQDEI